MRLNTKIAAGIISVSVLLGTAACGSSLSSSVDSSTAESGSVEFWGWDSGNSMKKIIAAFNEKYPKITVKFNATGNAQDTATALANAIAAGNGAPDVVMLEDPVVQQFAVQNQVEDLSQYGADKLKSDFTAGPWSKLQYKSHPYGLPIDSGPEMFFYNKTIFDKAGITEPPKTWDEYYQDAKKIHALGSNYYITNNAGDGNNFQPFTAQIWQAGAQPWKVNGDKLTINMTKDSGVKKYIELQQKLIDEDLINTKVANWSDDWNRGLNDGTIASLTIGAWMPVNLKSGAPDQKGNWRVASVPQWKEGDNQGSEDGGSALSLVSTSKNKKAAYTFISYMTHGDGAKLMADTGTFPSLKSLLTAKDFVDKTDDYFGGQKVNAVLAEAAQSKVSAFQYLPYTAYAQTVFGDSIGKAYSKQTTLAKAMQEYQDTLIKHGKEQGYTINE